MKTSKRKNPPPDNILEARRTWGSLLRTEVLALGKTEYWLGKQIYDTPGSINQVMNGHQGISREVYLNILKLVPAMKKYKPPPMTKVRQGKGSRTPRGHKRHVYPKTGRKAPHLPKEPRKKRARGLSRLLDGD